MANATLYFWLGAAGMGLATLAFIYRFVTDPRNRTFHLILTGITGIAAVAYVLMALGIGELTAANGSTVYSVRYLDWAMTTPLIILYLGLLAGVRRRTLVLVSVADVVMISMAFSANFVTGTTKYAVFAAATVLYAVLVYYLVSGIMSAVQRRPQPAVTLFEKLRNLTVVVWTFYPVVWILGPAAFGVLDETVKVVLMDYLDIISKATFGFIAMNSQRSLEQLPRLDALRFGGAPASD